MNMRDLQAVWGHPSGNGVVRPGIVFLFSRGQDVRESVCL